MIELVITLVVLGVLTALAMPNMSTAIANAKVRTSAEALQNGLRAAQAEAIRRNRQAAFVLTNATPSAVATPTADGKYWYVQALPAVDNETVPDAFVQSGQFGAQANNITINGPAIICFNSIGRVVTNATPGPSGVACSVPTSVTTYAVSGTQNADLKLAVQVSAAGKIRMCNTSRQLSAANPDGC